MLSLVTFRRLNPSVYKLLFRFRSNHAKEKDVSCNSGIEYNVDNLVNRSLIKISGNDSYQFLQGLITNDINLLLSGTPSIYAMFLNIKGRVLYDTIIYKSTEKNELLIECDSTVLNGLMKHMKMYRIRKKIDINPLSDQMNVWVVYNQKNITHIVEKRNKSYYVEKSKTDKLTGRIFSEVIKNTNIEQSIILKNINIGKDVTICPDPRLTSLGFRALVPKDIDFRQTLKTKGLCIAMDHTSQYRSNIYKLGIGEGFEDIPCGQCLPLEINCDYLQGVSFHKGCYIGQELTARTYHTGVVRKRLMPVYFDNPPTGNIPLDSPITHPTQESKVPIGKLRGINGDVGIAIMRITEALKIQHLKLGEYFVNTMRPLWWPVEVASKISASESN